MKRCNHCGCWNNEQTYCYNCNTRISHTKVLVCKECKNTTDVLVDGKCMECFKKSEDCEFTILDV